MVGSKRRVSDTIGFLWDPAPAGRAELSMPGGRNCRAGGAVGQGGGVAVAITSRRVTMLRRSDPALEDGRSDTRTVRTP